MQGCAVRRGGTLSRSAIRALLFKFSIKGAKIRSHGSELVVIIYCYISLPLLLTVLSDNLVLLLTPSLVLYKPFALQLITTLRRCSTVKRTG